MSKFQEVLKLLNEYDVRMSGQGIPSVPGDGYTATSDPNTIGNAAQFAPNRQKNTMPLKPFADEANQKDQGMILPYPLEHTFERLATLKVTMVEIQNILRSALNNGSLTKPQRGILRQQYKTMSNQIKQIEKFVQDLEVLSVPY